MAAVWTIVVILLISWAIFVQFSARRQVDLSVGLSERDAAQAIAGYFGALWTQVSGQGELNYRPKLRRNAPTLSISLRPVSLGQCEVSIWTSAFSTRYGLMEHAQLMWRKKRGLASRLAQATDPAGNRPTAS
jgi:hypothetical protein